MSNPGPSSTQQENTTSLIGVRLTQSEFANPSAAILANTNVVYQQAGVGGLWQSNGASLQQIPGGASGGGMLGYSTGFQTKTDADALESAALFTLDIPANTLGPNSVLLIVTHWTLSTAATWNLRLRFGGAVLDNVNITGNASLVRWFEMTNVNSRSLQETTPISSSSVGTFSAAALGVAGVDFGSATQLTITSQAVAAGSGSLSSTLKKVRVQHFYGA